MGEFKTLQIETFNRAERLRSGELVELWSIGLYPPPSYTYTVYRRVVLW